jgi:hypothetical protein
MAQAAKSDSHAGHTVGVVGVAKQGSTQQRRGTFALPRLVGSVDSHANITISDKTVQHGRYKLVVHDTATLHNWHITGQGVDHATVISGTGTFKWRVRLLAGSYHVQCDMHPATMHFDISVS